MEKEFIEYQSKDGTIPYPSFIFCNILTQYIKKYIKYSNLKINKNIRDEILIDVINYLGFCGGYDFRLTVSNLKDNKYYDCTIDPNLLLTVVCNFYSQYIFEYEKIKEKLKNEKYDIKDVTIILLDFINYVSEVNNFSRKFNLNDLFQKYKNRCHKKEMRKLKIFLELTGKYSQKLKNNENVDNIFEEIKEQYNLKKIEKDEYYYKDELVKQYKIDKMSKKEIKEVKEEIIALSYAYSKFIKNNEINTKNDIIKQNIKQIRKSHM